MSKYLLKKYEQKIEKSIEISEYFVSSVLIEKGIFPPKSNYDKQIAILDCIVVSGSKEISHPTYVKIKHHIAKHFYTKYNCW